MTSSYQSDEITKTVPNIWAMAQSHRVDQDVMLYHWCEQSTIAGVIIIIYLNL